MKYGIVILMLAALCGCDMPPEKNVYVCTQDHFEPRMMGKMWIQVRVCDESRPEPNPAYTEYVAKHSNK